jgi:beta-lactamase class A
MKMMDWRDATGPGSMRETATGLNRIRAAIPPGWDAGDKTGARLPAEIAGTYVELGYAVRPGGAPLVIGSWYNPPRPGTAVDPAAEAVLAEVDRIAVGALA